MNWNELLTRIKGDLKNLVNGDNAEAIASIDKSLDNADELYKAQTDELVKTKDTLVDFVKNTGFKEPARNSQEPTQEDEAISIDEAFEKGLKELKK